MRRSRGRYTQTNLPEGERMFALLSASSYQPAWEDNVLQSSLFSHYVLRGLTSDAAKVDKDRSGQVSTGELYQFVRENVEAYSKKKFQEQTPIISPSSDPNIALAAVPSPEIQAPIIAESAATPTVPVLSPTPAFGLTAPTPRPPTTTKLSPSAMPMNPPTWQLKRKSRSFIESGVTGV